MNSMKRFNMRGFAYAVLFGSVLAAGCAAAGTGEDAASDPPDREETLGAGAVRFRVEPVAGGLSHPWGMTFLPDGGILVTEREGSLALVRQGEVTRISGVPEVAAVGQGGLLDVVLHPRYEENGWIYFSYAEPGEGGQGTAVGRARLEGDRLAGFERLFTMARKTTTTQHFGSRLVFAPDGTLFISTGERGSQNRAQDLGDHAGKVLRITDSGGIPPDNPFVGRDDALPEIYSYGHRNIQGMAIEPETGELWAHEHGPRGGDEVNVIRPGANYGWPVITYGQAYSGGSVGIGTSAPGMEQPLIHWTPSIAPSGLAFYAGESFPGWRGDAFVGALAGRHLRRLSIEDGRIVGQEVLFDDYGRIRDVRTGPDGLLYFLTDEADGGLYVLAPGV